MKKIYNKKKKTWHTPQVYAISQGTNVNSGMVELGGEQANWTFSAVTRCYKTTGGGKATYKFSTVGSTITGSVGHPTAPTAICS